MGKREQLRFYSVSEFFLDDERIMAHAIVHFTQSTIKAEEIYTDLLECEIDQWVEPLEWIIDNISHSTLTEWINKAQRQFKSGIWAKGDEAMLTERAWKLKSYEKSRSKAHAVKIRRQLTIFDFIGW